MNHLSLFSGIGGLDLAAEWAGFTTVAFVERDPYCQRVLGKRWPGVPVLGDVRDLVADAEEPRGLEPPNEAHAGAGGWRSRDGSVRGGAVAVVSGGFPCQPHSVAGKREASADDRDLWPEVARVLREIRPRWFVGENVRGLLYSESGRFFGRVLGDLADLGYSVGWGVWGASDVGALHQRERVFIVAHAQHAGREGGGIVRQPRGRKADAATPCGEEMADADDAGLQGRLGGSLQERAGERTPGACGASASDADGSRPFPAAQAGIHRKEAGGRAWDVELERFGRWLVEPDVGRVANGVPARVDRLRALGNAVVPQQAYPLFAAIAEYERMSAGGNVGGVTHE